jgi:hypothetical protein
MSLFTNAIPSSSSCYTTVSILDDLERARRLAYLLYLQRHRGNGRPVSPSRTELLLLDWSPKTISCGRDTYSPTPLANNLSILFRRTGSAMLPTVDSGFFMLGIG